MIKVDNAIIMAAGMSSRFLPLTLHKPKALLEVKNEILIERLIRQLREAGINEIVVVGGYCFDSLQYLKAKFDVILVENKEYLTRNNHSSLFAVKDYLKNSYICSSDNYYVENVFKQEENEAYYSCVYTSEYTNEWVVEFDDLQCIKNVVIGKENGYYMLGHAFFDSTFSKALIQNIEAIYHLDSTKNLFWEDVYIQNIDSMTLKMHDVTDKLYEFDNLEELRNFDESYINDARCDIISAIAAKHNVAQSEIGGITPIKEGNHYTGFNYNIDSNSYTYYFEE